MAQMKVDDADKMKEYYEKKEIVEEYESKRFSLPIYSAEHERQILIINSLIKNEHLKRILEIAPGPARLTRYIESNGTCVEYSKEMIKLAKENLKNSQYNWNVVHGDAFKLSLKKNSFDLVFTFRFIRHYKMEDRKKLYTQIKSVLKDDGFLVFEALNLKKSFRIRSMVGKEKYNVYDELYFKEDLVKELEENGFVVVSIHPTIRHFFIQYAISRMSSILRITSFGKKMVYFFEKWGNNPLGWVVVCRKK
jgi:ubiquinone/menaquinone biosynthesis C-methylase UbiE